MQAQRGKKNASEVSGTFANKARISAHFVTVFKSATAEPVHVPPFNWRPGGREKDLLEPEATNGGAYEGGSYHGLLRHLELATPAGLVRQLRFEDVRQLQFSYEAHVGPDGSEGGTTVVNGFADSVFALKMATPESAWTLGCVVIDWKTPTAIAKLSDVTAQLTMEMLAFATSTRRKGPVLFVATDLRDRMRVWQLMGRRITEFRGDDQAFLSVSEGYGVVCALLPACITACTQWCESRERLPTLPEDDSDDDDVAAEDSDDAEGHDKGVSAAAGAGAPAGPAGATRHQGRGGRGSGPVRGRGHRGSLAENAVTSPVAAPDSPRSPVPLSPRSAHLYDDLTRHKKAERLLALTRLLPREPAAENTSFES